MIEQSPKNSPLQSDRPAFPGDQVISAWDIIRPLFHIAQEEAFAHHQQLSGQASQVADTREKIVPAAYHGRVKTLFVAAGVQQWGVFNPFANEIELHDQIDDVKNSERVE